MSTYVNTQLEGSSSRDWRAPFRDRLDRARDNDGFSLLELVVAVSIMLILAVVGTIAYQGITDNAREAAVESAAQATYTAALAAFHEPGGASGLNARLMGVQEQYNESADGIRVDIYAGHAGGAEAGADVCVVAQNEQHEQFVAYRGDCAGVDVPRGDNNAGGNNDPIMVSTWNVDAGETVALPISGFDGTVDWGDGVVNTETDHTYSTAGEKTITINGTFDRWGDGYADLFEDDYVALESIVSVDEWKNTETTNLSVGFAGSSIEHVAEIPAGVERVDNMFKNATKFDSDVSGWDMSKVRSTEYMFDGARNFNNGGEPLTWDVSNVKYMGFMFSRTESFNQSLNSWDVSGVQTMNDMFTNASAFNNGGEPLTWDVSNTDTYYMFYNASAFNNGGAPLEQWMIAAGA